jgi:hypothetical protein
MIIFPFLFKCRHEDSSTSELDQPYHIAQKYVKRFLKFSPLEGGFV